MNKVDKNNCCHIQLACFCGAKPNAHKECRFFVTSSETGYEDLCHYRVNTKNLRQDDLWYVCSNVEAITDRLSAMIASVRKGE